MRSLTRILLCALMFSLPLAGCTKANPTTTAGIQDTIKAKAIVIVDGHGKERIRLETREWWPNGPSSAVIHLAGETEGTDVEIEASDMNGAGIQLTHGKWLKVHLAAMGAGFGASLLHLEGAADDAKVSDKIAKISIYMDTNPFRGPKLQITGPGEWGRLQLAVDDQRLFAAGRNGTMEGPSLTMYKPSGKSGYWVGIAPELQERSGPR